MGDADTTTAGPDDDRGQAFTLEGLIGSLLVLSAVLFVLQATVFTPTTGGQVADAETSRMRQQAADILRTTATSGGKDLSYLVRYWNPSQRTFVDAENARVGYGTSVGRIPGNFGDKLAGVLGESGYSYNVYVTYRTPDGLESIPVVYRGAPPNGSSPVVATYRVTLYDNMTLTGPSATTAELWQYETEIDDDAVPYYPIPNAVDGPVYNVVEVRIVVW